MDTLQLHKELAGVQSLSTLLLNASVRLLKSGGAMTTSVGMKWGDSDEWFVSPKNDFAIYRDTYAFGGDALSIYEGEVCIEAFLPALEPQRRFRAVHANTDIRARKNLPPQLFDVERNRDASYENDLCRRIWMPVTTEGNSLYNIIQMQEGVWVQKVLQTEGIKQDPLSLSAIGLYEAQFGKAPLIPLKDALR